MRLTSGGRSGERIEEAGHVTGPGAVIDAEAGPGQRESRRDDQSDVTGEWVKPGDGLPLMPVEMLMFPYQAYVAGGPRCGGTGS